MTSPDAEERRDQVRGAMADHLSFIGLGTVVDVEDMYLLNDAMRCYIGGADAGTIFCAHAVCERDIAAEIAHSTTPPKNSEMWGLGAWIRYSADQQLLPEELLIRLGELNEHRKSLYHYGQSDSPRALQQRAMEWVGQAENDAAGEFARRNGYTPDNKDLWAFALGKVLRRDALAALVTAFQLRTRLSAG